ncbi:galactokinase family protein [Dolosicoccus paucivorans]
MEDIGVIREKLAKTFQEEYEESPVNTYFSPGRVNLIGEHIDYNGGYVFPSAITQGTYGVARKRDDKIVRYYSLNFPDFGPIEFDLEHIQYDEADEWVEYVKGMVQLTIEDGHTIDS